MKKAAQILMSLFLLTGLLLLPASAADPPFTIISVQHQDFVPYVSSYQGFVEGIKKLGYADMIKLETYNAKGDLKALDEKVAELSTTDAVDLVFSIGTQTSKRMKKHLKQIPFIFTNVGDPVHSGIVTDWKSSGANYTGVETPKYISMEIKMINELVKPKSIGMIYLAGSPSHDAAIKQISILSGELGFRFVYEGFPLRDENKKRYPVEVVRKQIKDALDKVAPQVEVVFVQISKTFLKHFDIFHDAFIKYKTLSVGEPIYITKGVIMGIGRDNRTFGSQCAEYAVKILEGANPADLPMDVGARLTIQVNLKAAVEVGYDPPVDLLGAADHVYESFE